MSLGRAGGVLGSGTEFSSTCCSGPIISTAAAGGAEGSSMPPCQRESLRRPHRGWGSLKKPGPAEQQDVAQSLWEEACEQAQDESGWLHGPFTAEQLDSVCPEGWITSRRFSREIKLGRLMTFVPLS